MSNLPEPRPSVERRAEYNSLAIEDLWLRCFALGTMCTPSQLEAFLRGDLSPTRHEYNLVAVALNEWLSDTGVAQFVPYIEDDAHLAAPWSRFGREPGARAELGQGGG